MDKAETARQAVIAIASEDPDWQPQDKRNVTVSPTDDPERFSFAVAGMASDYGCVVFSDGKPDVWFHDAELMSECGACGWTFE